MKGKAIKRKIVKGTINFLMRLVYRVKIIGEENIPTDTGCVICPNHVHALDSAAIVACGKRKIIFMAKKELFKSAGLRFLADIFDIFPVDREGNDIQAIKHSLKILKQKEILAMYPEGTRNGLAKGVKPKNGATLIAIKAGVPIVPVGVQGTFKPFTKVRIIYGKPMYFDKKDVDTQDKEKINSITKQVMDEVVRLTKQEY